MPFRETIIDPPKTDMVNEELTEENKVKDNNSDKEWIITLTTPNKQCTVSILALPMPLESVSLIEDHKDLLKANTSGLDLNEESLAAIDDFKSKLNEILNKSHHEVLHNANIVTFGSKRIGTNILINKCTGQDHQKFETSIDNGFQLATLAGPLCEEPISGCAFVCLEFSVKNEALESDLFGPLSGQIVSIVKEGCRRAFQAHPQRLMAAMYSCDINVKAEVLGKMYAVLSKRHGKIVQESMIEGSSMFTVTAHLPVIESFDFAAEIRKQTSGLAMPQLVFRYFNHVQLTLAFKVLF